MGNKGYRRAGDELALTCAALSVRWIFSEKKIVFFVALIIWYVLDIVEGLNH